MKDLLYSSESASHFYELYFDSKSRHNAQFSLRQWSYHLGYKNPSFISDVLKKKRKASPALLERFLAKAHLEPLEKIYLHNLTFVENVADPGLAQSRTEENKVIAKYWRQQEDLDIDPRRLPLDSMIEEAISFIEHPTLRQLTRELSPFLSAEKVCQRVEHLVKDETVLLQEGRYLDPNPERKINLIDNPQFKAILPVLEKATGFSPSYVNQNFMCLPLTKNEFKSAVIKFRGVFEEIILASENRDSREELARKQLCCLYTSSFRGPPDKLHE